MFAAVAASGEVSQIVWLGQGLQIGPLVVILVAITPETKRSGLTSRGRESKKPLMQTQSCILVAPTGDVACGGHSTQKLAPAALYLPGPHWAQEAARSRGAYRPAGHNAHCRERSFEENMPGAHAEHAVPLADAINVPAVHARA